MVCSHFQIIRSTQSSVCWRLPRPRYSLSSAVRAQNVTTQHYDNTRSGSYTTETQLTPSTVTPSNFSRLFSQSVDAQIYAQPLYMQNVNIGGTTHNVVFVATENDTVYAFDADTNGGTNASPLWKASMLTSAHGAASGATAIPQGDVSTTDITPIIGITGTPVIDPSTNTIYLVSASKENGSYVQRLHALDITSGAEKFGGPVLLSGTVSGNGNGSSGGTLTFDQKWHNNRAGLLLLNGIVYIAFAAHGDNGPWHGWILAYNASTLKQTSVWCSSANGIGAGIWMSGSGIAADNLNPTGNSPGGRLFVATGNGTFDAKTPYTNTMDYGDSIVRLHLNNGVMTVADDFTPLNQSNLNGADEDVASGGVLVLPDQSGAHTHLLFQTGKEGRFYIVDRDTMGGFSSSSDNIAQEIPVNGGSGSFPIAAGIWGMPAFFNNTMYIWGKNDVLKTFPMSSGKFPTSASSTGPTTIGFPSPTPVISSNSGASPILWSIETDNFSSGTNAVLRATDATNIGNTLYDSSAKSSDNPGGAVKFNVPTVANGKVYVGATNQLSIYGLTNGQTRHRNSRHKSRRRILRRLDPGLHHRQHSQLSNFLLHHRHRHHRLHSIHRRDHRKLHHNHLRNRHRHRLPPKRRQQRNLHAANANADAHLLSRSRATTPPRKPSPSPTLRPIRRSTTPSTLPPQPRPQNPSAPPPSPSANPKPSTPSPLPAHSPPAHKPAPPTASASPQAPLPASPSASAPAPAS